MHRISRLVTVVLTFVMAMTIGAPAAGAAVTPLWLESVSFSDADHGVLSGGFGNQTGFVSMTDDGGVNWRAVRLDPNRWYRAASAGDGSGAAVALDLFSGASHATTGMGETWWDSTVDTGVELHDVDLEGPSRGWAVGVGSTDMGEPGDPAVIHTTNDGGRTWDKTFAGPFYWKQDDENSEPYLTSNSWLRCVDGADANTAWAIGLLPSSKTLIMKTTNGGSSWTTQTINLTTDPESAATYSHYEVWGVSAPSTQVVYAVGVADRIYSTTDGGAHWTVRPLGTATKVLYDISMATTSTGWAVGNNGRILKTTNGWATWVAQSNPAGIYGTALRSVHSIDASRAWVVGDNETILYTTNGGTTWQGSVTNHAPSAAITAPSTGAMVTGATYPIAGTSTDGIGVGVATVSVSIQRDDARYWNGSTWQSTAAWLDAGSADYFETWDYDWQLEPGQNREHSYSLAWRAVDAVTNAAQSGSVVTGVRVDNAGPSLLSAYQVDSTHVRAAFSEPLDPGSVDLGDLTIAGLSVTGASVVTTATSELLLTTSAQTQGQTYQLTAASGAVQDPYGNASAAGSDQFTAAGGAVPLLTVSQGSAAGRPTQAFDAAPGSTVVVDQVVVGAGDDAVTMQSITVQAAGANAASFAADVDDVSLINDADRDGRISAGDTTLAATPAAGTAVSLAPALAVSANATRSVLVAYTLSSGASDAHAIGSRVTTAVAAAPGVVDPFGAIVSAAGGSTVRIDAQAPSVAIASHGDGAWLSGVSAAISGTAADTASGLQSMRVRIARSDGQYWDGTGWSATETWTAIAEGGSWTYDWDLDAGQTGASTYDITVGAYDAVGHLGQDTITGVRVDNTAPEMTGVTAVDATHVDVTFSEAIATATVASADFLASGLTLSGATLQPGGTAVRLTVAGAEAGTRYTLSVSADGVADPRGNACASASETFIAAGAGREAGADRYVTAVAISQSTYRAGECTNAVLATGEGFPDALAASGLAGTVRGPLLLTRGTSLPSSVATELARLGVTKVWLAGGTGAVAASVQTSLAAFGYEVERIAGANRYDTAADIAAKVAQLRGAAFDGQAFLARGDDFADALAVAPASAARGIPVLLTPTAGLPVETAGAITGLGISDVVIVGGTGAVSADAEGDAVALGATVTREAGANRYATAAEVADRCVTEGWLDDTFAGVATGRSFADALGGGVSAGAKGGVLLLTDPSSLSAATSGFITAHPSIEAVAVYGGTGAVSSDVLAQIAALL